MGFGVGPGGEADVERAAEQEHVPSVDACRGLDAVASPMGGKCVGDSLGFPSSRFGARTGDEGYFVQDEGGVLHEDRIGVVVERGKRDDLASECGQRFDVVLVLSVGIRQIDRGAIDVGEFAGSDRIGNASHDGDGVCRRHDVESTSCRLGV